MAANGARKSAPDAPKRYNTKHNLVDDSIYDKIFTEDDHKPIKEIKFKKTAPKQTNPGHWMDNQIVDTHKKDDTSRPTTPLVNPVDDKMAAAFPTGRPLEDQPDMIQCKHCKKPVMRPAASAHVKECLKKKQEKLQKKKEAKEAKEAASRKERNGGKDDEDEAGEKINRARKSATKGSGGDGLEGAKKGKKRKADEVAEKAVKKKKKDEPKPKGGKAKGPIDVERQCGVQLPNGAQCARSLTCKSHSMGAKRAVPGRSLPYDMLLAQYQKKNQAKQQRAAMDANAPLQDDFDTHGPVDSDEEKEAVMLAITRARPQPIATSTYVPTAKKYQYMRMKEMLHNALGGSRGGGLFSTGARAATVTDSGHGGIFAGTPGVPGEFAINSAGLSSAGIEGGVGCGD